VLKRPTEQDTEGDVFESWTCTLKGTWAICMVRHSAHPTVQHMAPLVPSMQADVSIDGGADLRGQIFQIATICGR